MTPANMHVGAGTLTLNPDSSPVSFDSSAEGATLTFSAELEDIMVDQVLCYWILKPMSVLCTNTQNY